jgi:hypothetical protein
MIDLTFYRAAMLKEFVQHGEMEYDEADFYMSLFKDEEIQAALDIGMSAHELAQLDMDAWDD